MKTVKTVKDFYSKKNQAKKEGFALLKFSTDEKHYEGSEVYGVEIVQEPGTLNLFYHILLIGAGQITCASETTVKSLFS